MGKEVVVLHQGESFVVNEGDKILDAERVRNVWHVARLTADGKLDLRVFWLESANPRLWYPSESKRFSFEASRVYAALVDAIGTEAEKQAWLDSTDVPICRAVNTPWSDDGQDKTHTSSLPSLQQDPHGCLHCTLVNLAEFIPITSDDFPRRMQALGVPQVILDQPGLHLNLLVSRSEWLAEAFRGRFDEGVYKQHRAEILEDALALSLHLGAEEANTKQNRR